MKIKKSVESYKFGASMMFIGLGVRGSRWAVGLDTGRRVDDDEDNTAVRPPAPSHQPPATASS